MNQHINMKQLVVICAHMRYITSCFSGINSMCVTARVS